jgi:hypothetical protein
VTAPTIHPDAFVHPDAVVIGDVVIGADSSVWPGAVLRGDYGSIIVGERTSIQDGAVVHAVGEYPTVIGRRLRHRPPRAPGGMRRSTTGRSWAAGRSCCTRPSSSAEPRWRGGGGAQPHERAGQFAGRWRAREIKSNFSSEQIIESQAASYVANAKRYKKELRLL